MSQPPLRCANHPQVETLLRCSKCDKPICPRCGVRTPVGVRCRECAALQRLPTYRISPLIALRGFGAGLAVAAACGAAMWFVAGFSLWLSPVAGLLVGEGISQATNHKRGWPLQVIAAATVLLGTMLGNFLVALFLGGADPAWLLGGRGCNPLYVALAALFAIIRLR